MEAPCAREAGRARALPSTARRDLPRRDRRPAAVRENGGNLIIVRRYRGVSATIFSGVRRFAMMAVRVERACHAACHRASNVTAGTLYLHYERAFMTSISNSSSMLAFKDDTSSAAPERTHIAHRQSVSYYASFERRDGAQRGGGVSRSLRRQRRCQPRCSFVAGEGGGVGAMRASLQRYESAMRQMEVRFEVLDRDLSLKKNRNPITTLNRA